MTETRWSLVIHGGAGSIERHRLTPEQDAGVRTALALALERGGAILSAGGAALDAVAAAVKVLEDDPHFNAGRGAAFGRDGEIELDAAIMDGRTRAAGAVAGLTATRSPVALARRVMEASPHVLLSGRGAEAFARDQGLEAVDPAWFATPERRRQLDELLARAQDAQDADAFDIDMKYGTVGAVACDAAGHLAAATSTGGVTGKRWGRIGDSPLIGAGTYADNRAAAISCTGAGEYFIREGVAHEIAARLRFTDDTPQQAADAVLADVQAMGGTGGVIVAEPDGTTAWSMTTAGMYRGRAGSDGVRQVALYGKEG